MVHITITLEDGSTTFKCILPLCNNDSTVLPLLAKQDALFIDSEPIMWMGLKYSSYYKLIKRELWSLYAPVPASHYTQVYVISTLNEWLEFSEPQMSRIPIIEKGHVWVRGSAIERFVATPLYYDDFAEIAGERCLYLCDDNSLLVVPLCVLSREEIWGTAISNQRNQSTHYTTVHMLSTLNEWLDY